VFTQVCVNKSIMCVCHAMVKECLYTADAHPVLYIIEGWKFMVEGCKLVCKGVN
jgi:hypothetical protein